MRRANINLSARNRRRAIWREMMEIVGIDEVEMTPIELIELRLNVLSESLDRLRREMHETQRNMTDLQAAMRLEHHCFREDCNELFEMVRTIERSQRQDVSELTRGYRDVIDDGALDLVPGWEAS